MVAASLAMRWSLSDFWDNARYLEIESGLFTFILIAGATLEYWPQLKEFALQTLKVLRFWRTLPYERRVLKKLAFPAVAPLLVVIGIAGELVFETRTFIVEDLETTSLSQEAKDAKTAADGAVAGFNAANQKLTAIETTAEALDKRLDAAGNNVDAVSQRADQIDAELKEEVEVLNSVIPRSSLLDKAAQDIAKKLSPFDGQKVSVLLCGLPPLPKKYPESPNIDKDFIEKREAWSSLVQIIFVTAKWGKNDHSIGFWDKCMIPRGITVFFNLRALARTQVAAKVLNDE